MSLVRRFFSIFLGLLIHLIFSAAAYAAALPCQLAPPHPGIRTITVTFTKSDGSLFNYPDATHWANEIFKNLPPNALQPGSNDFSYRILPGDQQAQFQLMVPYNPPPPPVTWVLVCGAALQSVRFHGMCYDGSTFDSHNLNGGCYPANNFMALLPGSQIRAHYVFARSKDKHGTVPPSSETRYRYNCKGSYGTTAKCSWSIY